MMEMTRTEREDLSKIVRLRAKVTRAHLDTLAATRKAEVERQLSTTYQASADDWKAITASADTAVEEADAAIAAICESKGIPASFRPRLSLSWWDRGENGIKSRRAELRDYAYTRIDADKKAGYQRIEAWAADSLTSLISGSLSSDEAKNFLDALPAPEALLPPINIAGWLDA